MKDSIVENENGGQRKSVTEQRAEIRSAQQERVNAVLGQAGKLDGGEESIAELRAIVAKQVEANPNTTTYEMLRLTRLENIAEMDPNSDAAASLNAPKTSGSGGTVSRFEELEWKFGKHQDAAEEYVMPPEQISEYQIMLMKANQSSGAGYAHLSKSQLADRMEQAAAAGDMKLYRELRNLRNHR